MVEQAARILGSTRTDLELAIIEERERHVFLGADRLAPGRHPPDGQRALGTRGRGLVGSAASALAAGRERHGDLRAVRVISGPLTVPRSLAIDLARALDPAALARRGRAPG